MNFLSSIFTLFVALHVVAFVLEVYFVGRAVCRLVTR